MWILKSAQEATDPLTFRILPGNVKTIGRSPGAQFIVDAALVSRLHCRLSAGATELQVDDLDSTNGTFVNGKRVKRSSLKEGDRLGVGRVELVISREADSARLSD
jgi:pSer/pThr/pTyr-binding forkhead associated (FHA) protein